MFIIFKLLYALICILCSNFIFMNFYEFFSYVERKGGGSFSYIFCFFSRTTWQIFMKLGRYEVLMVPYKCCCFSSRSVNRWRHHRQKYVPEGTPSLTNFFFRTEACFDKPKASVWFREMSQEVLLFLVPLRNQIFDAFLTSFRVLSEMHIFALFL